MKKNKNQLGFFHNPAVFLVVIIVAVAGTFLLVNSKALENKNVISIQMVAAPGTIKKGQSSVISWDATNATHCQGALGLGFLRNAGVHNHATVYPTSAIQDYGLNCSNNSTSKSAQIHVYIK
jgi:hypothetical protein